MKAAVLEKKENNINKDINLDQFDQLMNEIAKLPEQQRNIVAVYSQGVLAMAQQESR